MELSRELYTIIHLCMLQFILLLHHYNFFAFVCFTRQELQCFTLRALIVIKDKYKEKLVILQSVGIIRSNKKQGNKNDHLHPQIF